MAEMWVRWEINIEASSPEEAAQKAREIQLDKESTATFFEVRVQGVWVDVDTETRD